MSILLFNALYKTKFVFILLFNSLYTTSVGLIVKNMRFFLRGQKFKSRGVGNRKV